MLETMYGLRLMNLELTILHVGENLENMAALVQHMAIIVEMAT